MSAENNRADKASRKHFKDVQQHMIDMSEMENNERVEALIRLGNRLRDKDRRVPMSFNNFLNFTKEHPDTVLRDIFQLFHDMVRYYVPQGRDEYGESYESAGFLNYDCYNLFKKGCDNPFFADRLFANRLINMVSGFKKGIQNNHIFLFEGPPGSGKSTFLNNLLLKLEEYVRRPEGAYYKTYWRLNIEKMGGVPNELLRPLEEAAELLGDEQMAEEIYGLKSYKNQLQRKYLEFSCPKHDHPILQVPKSYRMQFLDELFPRGAFKEKLFHRKEYEWVLKDIPCSICKSLYETLLDIFRDPLEVFNMIYARRIHFNRQFGSGITIFNPGDPIYKKPITNDRLQKMVRDLLRNDGVDFTYSVLAKTNNGVYALMDIKENNIERLKDLHGIISDGVHKVDLVEERIKSLFIGLVNPEDKMHYENVKSFQDRIITVKIPYVLDYNTEVAIYRDKFGKQIDALFLPGVLTNVAKIIVSTRLNNDSPTIRNWLRDTDRYRKYLDRDHLLLKMDLYTGVIPDWLSEDDVKNFSREVRKSLLAESETEGLKGLSGRQSLNVFNDLLTSYSSADKLITMAMVTSFFSGREEPVFKEIPSNFMNSLEEMYDYNVIQELKEAIYYFNEPQISRDIQNYLFAVNYDLGAKEKSPYTGDVVEVTEEYLKGIEVIFLGTNVSNYRRDSFRADMQNEYVTRTVSQEMRLDGKELTDTEQYKNLFEKYTRNLKENALAPYAKNENFRRAILDLGTQQFNTYDERLKRDVTFMLDNMKEKFGYTPDGARQIALYALDKKLPEKY